MDLKDATDMELRAEIRALDRIIADAERGLRSHQESVTIAKERIEELEAERAVYVSRLEGWRRSMTT